MLKYEADDADDGSTEARTEGKGVVLRLRRGPEGFEPGFGRPLLLVFFDIATRPRNAGGCPPTDCRLQTAATGECEEGIRTRTNAIHRGCRR